MKTHYVSALVAAAGLCTGVMAQTTYNESEPNDDKLRADGPFALAAGDKLAGNSTSGSTTGLDYFTISTQAAALGIYKHRLVVTTAGTAGHTISIRGRDRLGGLLIPSTDATLQTSSTATSPARHVAWYGFGKGESLMVRVNGAAATTADYEATLDTTPVTATDLGTLPGGAMTISTVGQGHTTDTEVWVYDANLNPIPGYNNDDEAAPGTSTQSKLTRDFSTAGVYYLAVAPSNLANNLDSSAEDRDTSSDVMDFANGILSSATGNTSINVSFVVTDGAAVDHPVAATRDNPYDVVWFKFTVTAPAEPTLGVCCFPLDGPCVRMTSAGCAANSGVYQGDGTVCATTDCPPPGACCFGADYTCRLTNAAGCTAAGGVFQGIGSACAQCPAPPPGSVVLVSAADSTGAQIGANTTDVQAKLNGTGLFPAGGVVIFNANRGAPTAEYLGQFDAALTWSNGNYFDARATGDALADYVDAGGGVVVCTPANSSTTPYRWLLGRWEGTYEIIPSQGGNNTAAATLGTVLDPSHPIMVSVASLTGPLTNLKPNSTALQPHGVKVAEWSTGKTLVAVSNQYARRVDLGLYPPSTDANSTGWTATTDGARLMANALRFAGRPLSTCYGNCDGSTATPVLNVADFTCFLTKYASGDPYANCDGSTAPPTLNVADFTCFLTSYAGGCP